MTISIIQEGVALPVSQALCNLLDSTLQAKQIDPSEHRCIVFSFLDQSYDPVLGGFHPVEIGLARQPNGWRIQYITDFSYQGYGDSAELDKELDFNLATNEFQHIYFGYLDRDDARELYRRWERNFRSYHAMGAYHTTLQLDNH